MTNMSNKRNAGAAGYSQAVISCEQTRVLNIIKSGSWCAIAIAILSGPAIAKEGHGGKIVAVAQSSVSQQVDPDMPDLTGVAIITHRINESMYVLEASGDTAGNIGVLVGENGMLIVDDQFDELTPQIVAALEEIGPGQLKYILNTHHHADHSGGNAALSRNSHATIVAHDWTRQRLLRGDADGLPVITFNKSLSIHFENEVVKLLSLPGGHTDNDTVVLFETSNVVHLGDLMNSGISSFPLADLDAGGNALRIRENVERLLSIVPDGATVIPGHGPITAKDELFRLYAMLSETIEFVSNRKLQGRSLKDIQKEGLPEAYADWGTGYTDASAWTEMIYRSIDP